MRRIGGPRLLFVIAACSSVVLTGCSDPVLVGLTGSPDSPKAMIDPCRSDWFTQRSLTVIDASTKVVVWRVESVDDEPIDMQSVTYGQPPEGAEEVVPAATLSDEAEVQWRFESPGSQPIWATFSLRNVLRDHVVTTDGELHPLAEWLTCSR